LDIFTGKKHVTNRLHTLSAPTYAPPGRQRSVSFFFHGMGNPLTELKSVQISTDYQ